MSIRKPIYYVSAPCGAGKTTGTADYIEDNLLTTSFLVVVPTLQLARQWQASLKDRGIVAKPVTSDTMDHHVLGAVLRAIEELNQFGEVLIITWNAYDRLPYRLVHKNIQVIIDELPQTDEFFPWNVSSHIGKLKNLIEIESNVNDSLAIVRARNVSELDRSLLQSGDDIDEMFRAFKRHLLSPNRNVFVDLAAFDRVVFREMISKSNQEINQVGFLSMLNPTLFEGAILLGANVQTSILYRWLTGFYKARFIEHTKIVSRLPTQFPKGDMLRLYHFFDGDVRASKEKFKRCLPNGQRLIDDMDRTSVDVLGSDEFLFVANNGRKSELLQHPNALKMPVESRGLNSYRHVHGIFVAFALNRKPQHIKMMNQLGLPSDLIYQATTCEQAYQAVMRTSLRNQKPDHIVTAVVPDLITARYVAHAVGGGTITKLPLSYVQAEKPAPYTPAEKKQRHRAVKAHNKLLATKRVPKALLKVFGGHLDVQRPEAPQGRGELATLARSNFLKEAKPLSLEGKQITCCVTFHANKWVNTEADHHACCFGPKEFVAYLKTQALSPRDFKDDRAMFNPAIFRRPEGGSGWRTIANFQASSLLVLDFDGGSISPEQFIGVFGPDACPGRRLSFAIYNSFSRSAEQPNKFHVVVFFSQPARSVDEHKAVYAGIVRRLEVEGFTCDGMKLDKCSGVQSFYIPSTNRAHPDAAFFQSFAVTERELRKAIVPASYQRTVIPEAARLHAPRSAVERKPGDVEAVLAGYRGMRSGRNKPILKACSKLDRLQVPHSEILTHITQTFGSSPKVTKKFRDAMRTIKGDRVRERTSSPSANTP